MRRLAFLVACPLALTLTLGMVTAPALAGGGTTTSAGDQQYVDPLTSTTPQPSHPHPHHTSTSQSTTTSPGASSSSGSGTLSQTPPNSFGSSPTGTGAPSTSDGSSSDTGQMLPFTGLNVWACLAAGLGLLGSGLALRLIARRA